MARNRKRFGQISDTSVPKSSRIRQNKGVTTESVLRALAGGALIGLAAAIALVANGRIAGISGTLGRALDADEDAGRPFRIAFLGALIATGAIAFQVVPSAFGANVSTAPVLAAAGLLVGIGTTLGNGCTSGHGVCGIARGSKRSLVAVGVFMATAMLTVAIRGAL
jgi:uncharacterized membrane protein YedE/YeeE